MKWSVMTNATEGFTTKIKGLVGTEIRGHLGRGVIRRVDEMINSKTGDTANLVRFEGNLALFVDQFISLDLINKTNVVFFGWPRNVTT